ncbi:unnamed protein product [Amoebophrya sp. A25]|nr:unnamed protein product [Amoebophrya sp. A25]|eukprot:GSA25T00019420001.1
MKIDFYFDVISPYAYMTYAVLLRYEKLWNFKLELHPIFLGGIMKMTGNKPPALLPARTGYVIEEQARARAFFGMKDMLAAPQNFFSEVAREVVQIQRLLLAAKEVLMQTNHNQNHGRDGKSQGDGGKKKMKSDLIFRQIVQRAFDLIHTKAGRRPGTDDVKLTAKNISGLLDVTESESPIAELMITPTDSLGTKLSIEKRRQIWWLARSEEIKKKLVKNTEACVATGAFGVPWMLVEADDPGSSKKLRYFGSDRFEDMAFFCNKQWLGPDPDRTLRRRALITPERMSVVSSKYAGPAINPILGGKADEQNSSQEDRMLKSKL